MGLTETFVFYLLIGAGVAAGLFVRDDRIPAGARLFRTATGLFFWPLYLPLLLGRPQPQTATTTRLEPASSDSDELASAIAQVEAELDAALRSLDGWAEAVLAGEHDRFGELKTAWRGQAARIRELDRLLAQPDFATAGNGPNARSSPTEGDRIHRSEQARQENLARLRRIRARLYDDLMGTLAWVRELVTMIHLARFTGAPAARAEELVTQIAAAVEGLSEASAWPEQPFARSA